MNLDPDWVSINMGSVICLECSGVHRSLGVQVSKVRSLNLDSWEEPLLSSIATIGNKIVNSFWESKVQDEDVMKEKSDRQAFIKFKYVDRVFIDVDALKSSLDTESLEEAAFKALQNDDIVTLLKISAIGTKLKDIRNKQGQSLLHLACSQKGTSTSLVEFLIQNGVKYLEKDPVSGKTPLELCQKSKNDEIAALLNSK